MNYLHAPWREKYYGEKRTECPFCARSEGVVWGDTRVSVMMNKYPYSLPHLLIIPHEHLMFASELAEGDWLQICRLARVAEQILREDFGAAGVNVGLNLGAAAGAGIAEHLHMHVLARWAGDTNFITTIASTRVLGADAGEILERARAAFARHLGGCGCDGTGGCGGTGGCDGTGAGGEGAGGEGICEKTGFSLGAGSCAGAGGEGAGK